MNWPELRLENSSPFQGSHGNAPSLLTLAAASWSHHRFPTTYPFEWKASFMLLSLHRRILRRSQAPAVQIKLRRNGLPFLSSCTEDAFLCELHSVPLGAPPHGRSCPMSWPELLSVHQNNLTISRAHICTSIKKFLSFKMRTFKRLFRV